jgi:hypothetical protein
MAKQGQRSATLGWIGKANAVRAPTVHTARNSHTWQLSLSEDKLPTQRGSVALGRTFRQRGVIVGPTAMHRLPQCLVVLDDIASGKTSQGVREGSGDLQAVGYLSAHVSRVRAA